MSLGPGHAGSRLAITVVMCYNDKVQDLLFYANRVETTRVTSGQQCRVDERATPVNKSLDELRRAGDHRVDSDVVLVLTRFGLRHLWQLPLMYWDFRRIKRRAERTPGLLRATFLVSGPRSCFSLSLWKNADSIPLLSSHAPQHVDVARRSFGRLQYHDGIGPELWSTKWRLVTVSNNLRWSGFDLTESIRSSE